MNDILRWKVAIDGLTDKGWLVCHSDKGVGLGYCLGYGCTVEKVGKEFPSLVGQRQGLAPGAGHASGLGQAPVPGLGAASLSGTGMMVQKESLWARYLEHSTKEVVRINATARESLASLLMFDEQRRHLVALLGFLLTKGGGGPGQGVGLTGCDSLNPFALPGTPSFYTEGGDVVVGDNKNDVTGKTAKIGLLARVKGVWCVVVCCVGLLPNFSASSRISTFHFISPHFISKYSINSITPHLTQFTSLHPPINHPHPHPYLHPLPTHLCFPFHRFIFFFFQQSIDKTKPSTASLPR